MFVSRDCLTERLEEAASACGCSAELAIRQVPLVSIYRNICELLSAKSLKQVQPPRNWGFAYYFCFAHARCTHSSSQLVSSNRSQVGSSLAEGVYMKVCKGHTVVDRFKIVRQGFIAGDGGRHWMHHHEGGERSRNSVLQAFAVTPEDE